MTANVSPDEGQHQFDGSMAQSTHERDNRLPGNGIALDYSHNPFDYGPADRDQSSGFERVIGVTAHE